jgi:hypothetical protein
MTNAMCAAYCAKYQQPYSGTEFGKECYCGWRMMNGDHQGDVRRVNTPCKGFLVEIINNGLDCVWNKTSGSVLDVAGKIADTIEPHHARARNSQGQVPSRRTTGMTCTVLCST